MKSFSKFKHDLTESAEVKLWLDDLRPMPSAFNTLAKTAKEAIKILKTNKVTQMSFDHDLGPPEAGTGYDVASWVEEAAYNGDIKQFAWKIHSANPVGVRKMKQALENADRFWNK